MLSVQSNSTLLRSTQAKFEALKPEDVEALAFLVKAVRRKRLQIKEAITLTPIIYGDDLMFLESLPSELFKNEFFYCPLIYSF